MHADMLISPLDGSLVATLRFQCFPGNNDREKRAVGRIRAALSRRNLSASINHLVTELSREGFDIAADLLLEAANFFRRWEHRGFSALPPKEEAVEGGVSYSFSFVFRRKT